MKGIRYVAASLLLIASVLSTQAAPPEVPAKLTAKAGSPVVFDVKADKPFSFAPGFDKSKCAIVRLHSDDAGVASFMAFPSEAGTFYVTFWTHGEKERGFSQTIIDTTGGSVVPPVAPNPKDPPAIPAPATALYFAIVGVDGPASPAVTTSLLLPEWAELVKAGHAYKYFTNTEAKKLGIKGDYPPFVAALRKRADGKSDQVFSVELPKTGADVLALPSLAKDK